MDKESILIFDKKYGLNSQIVNSTLAFMELKGWIKNLGNMTYILNN
jgi:hypothetical protein